MLCYSSFISSVFLVVRCYFCRLCSRHVALMTHTSFQLVVFQSTYVFDFNGSVALTTVTSDGSFSPLMQCSLFGRAYRIGDRFVKLGQYVFVMGNGVSPSYVKYSPSRT